LIYLVHLDKYHHASTLGFSTRTVNAFMVLANRAMTSDHSCRCNSPDFVSEYMAKQASRLNGVFRAPTAEAKALPVTIEGEIKSLPADTTS
jgi:hypothetical protein